MLSRRRVMAAGARIGLGSGLMAASMGLPSPMGAERPRFAALPGVGALSPYRADDFVESVGACTHLSSEPYVSLVDVVDAAIGHSGIRHLRDELRPDNDLGRWDRLYRDFGARSHLLVSPATNSIREMMAYLAALGPGRVSAVEGQNEGDSDWFQRQPQAKPNWHKAVVAYQMEVYRTLRARHPAGELPILSPSVLDYRPQDVALIRAAADYSDIIAIHPYAQHGEEPETEADYASIAWYLGRMGQAFKPRAPCMATEAGYSNVVQVGSSGISQRSAERYLPRLLLHNFAAGVRRTFLYEFMDGGGDADDPEHNYGLLQHGGAAKPSYHAIRNLLRALADPGPPFDPGKLDLVFLDAPRDLRCVPFQNRSGQFLLALWRAVRNWDPATARDLAVEGRDVSVDAMQSFSRLERLMPDMDGTWSRLPLARGRLVVSIDDRVTLLRFTR